MAQVLAGGWRTRVLVAVLSSMMLLAYAGPPYVADAQGPGVTGGAFGFFANVGLFGGPPGAQGPLPSVTLPPDGGDESASEPSGVAQYGPATIFGSGELTVSTEGTTEPEVSVTSAATVDNIDNREAGGPFLAGAVSSTCTATEGELSGSTTLTDAIVELALDPVSGEPTEVEELPIDPAPNTEYTGTLDHVGDNFRLVLNEQVTEGETITVRAAHMYLLGPIAVGELIIGESVCGIGAAASGPPGGDDTTTTAPFDGTTTTDAGATTTTLDEAGDDGGGGGSALLIGAVVVGVGLLAALLLGLRRRGGATGPG